MYTVTPIPAFNDNYIWALSSASDPDSIFVVDPGDAAPVESYLTANNLELKGILITHHHQDHTGGVNQLRESHNAAVYGPKSSPFEGIQTPLSDGESIEVLGNRLDIKEVPGHTLDHICYFHQDDKPQIFCGDTLFLAGCGRIFEGTPDQMHQAMEYFRQLPESTEIYCTHEYSLANLEFALAVELDNEALKASKARCIELREKNQPTLPTLLATEKQINPFLRYGSASVKASAEQFAGKPLQSECDVFTAVREWKNQF